MDQQYRIQIPVAIFLHQLVGRVGNPIAINDEFVVVFARRKWNIAGPTSGRLYHFYGILITVRKTTTEHHFFGGFVTG